MANFQRKTEENEQFWEWFFQVEEISGMPLEHDQALVITHKATDGERRTYDAVHLKPMLQKRRS